jgi:hypothetical protein
MHFPVLSFTEKACCLAAILLCAGWTQADPRQTTYSSLPDIPSTDSAKPGHFGLDGERVELGYATREQKWGARLDEYLGLERSVTLDYGTLLTDELGAGAALRQGSTYSDLWVNGVYAPDRDFRLRFAGGKLRANDAALDTGGAPSAVQQNSVLLGARRSWRGGLVSGIGMTAYAVEANDAAAAHAASLNAVPSDAQAPTGGSQQGHVLNLSLQPTSQSKIDLSRERNRLAYYSTDGTRGGHDVVASRVRFSQYFDNCMQLQGGYSSSEDSNRLDLSVGRDRWHVSVSRVEAFASNDTTVGIGYTLPLGSTRNGGANCALHPKARTFEPVIDTTVSRPEQFPRDPLISAGTLE